MSGVNYMSIPGIKLIRTGAPNAKSKIEVSTVVDIVCEHFGVTMKQLQSLNRHGKIPYIRQVIMYMFIEFNIIRSSLAIGRYFNRNHGTVISGLERIRNLMDTEEKVLNEVRYLQLKIIDAS